MRKHFTALAFFVITALSAFAITQAPQKALVAPGTLSAGSATLVWNKPVNYSDVVRYHILLDGKDVATSGKTDYTFKDLKPSNAYTCVVKAEDNAGKLSAASITVR